LSFFCFISVDGSFQEEAAEENDEKSKKADHQFGVTWRAKNNAERIFALMPEKNSHSYCTMIRGMVKHRAPVQALNLYTELLNNRLRADVYTFNALIEATALSVNKKMEDKWNNILELLKQMAAQKVKPNLQTFNTILKCLRRFHAFGRLPALQTFREMKAIGIEPSLATYHYIIQLFYHHENPSKGSSLIIYDIMNELTGKKFSPKDPDDDMFFQSAMRAVSTVSCLTSVFLFPFIHLNSSITRAGLGVSPNSFTFSFTFLVQIFFSLKFYTNSHSISTFIYCIRFLFFTPLFR